MIDPTRKADAWPGRFITLEGIEGSGKSTLLPHIRTLLEAKGKSVVITREPGGTSLGEQLRRLLLDPIYGSLTPDAELLMIFAARIEHLDKVIKPALQGGHWVVCDRFTDATYVYQGEGRRIPRARIDALAEWLQRDVPPDLTLVFDVPAPVGLKRVSRRGQKDRFEREKRGFFERLREAYLKRAAEYPSRCQVIDASVPLEVVRQRVAGILTALVHAA
jgi:dTMP kinase